jgi:ParB-like chromosome segregation protein Spo0J
MIKWTEKSVKVSALKPFERNPRRISQEAFNRLKKSLSENGYHQRIIVTKDLRVIGGHQRIKALKEIGLKEVPRRLSLFGEG